MAEISKRARLIEAPFLFRDAAHCFRASADLFSAKTFKALPPRPQDAILNAGADAAAYGRDIEQAEAAALLDTLERQGKLTRTPVGDRAAMKALADPVLTSYAKEIGAEALLATTNAAK
jgi:TRAP-type C4-dicarboxylate transport system substrate-binding protein